MVQPAITTGFVQGGILVKNGNGVQRTESGVPILTGENRQQEEDELIRLNQLVGVVGIIKRNRSGVLYLGYGESTILITTDGDEPELGKEGFWTLRIIGFRIGGCPLAVVVKKEAVPPPTPPAQKWGKAKRVEREGRGRRARSVDKVNRK